jgi:hypothetical protein
VTVLQRRILLTARDRTLDGRGGGPGSDAQHETVEPESPRP